MKFDEFIKHVQSVGQFESREAAIQAAKATLETLRERIVGDEASQLAAQLPGDLADCLHGREGQMGDHFPIEEFYRRICEREGVDPETAAMHVRAVFTVLQSAVTPGEFADVRSNLSEDYEELFATGSTIER
jgi:uncharacterized protein (DUF2267 family)